MGYLEGTDMVYTTEFLLKKRTEYIQKANDPSLPDYVRMHYMGQLANIAAELALRGIDFAKKAN